MSQFDEFSSRSETVYLEEEPEEGTGLYDEPLGRDAGTLPGGGEGAQPAPSQPDAIELNSGAQSRPAAAPTQAAQGGGMETRRSGGTLLAEVPLLSDAEDLRRQWESVQVGFVDDPRRAVGEADSLVSTVIDELVAGFRQQRYNMEAQWSEGGEVSTDELRDAFQRYRNFFERLLKV